jgi:hypothetical protein
LSFLFWDRAALAIFSTFPAVPPGTEACTVEGQQTPGYGINPSAEGIIHSSYDCIVPGLYNKLRDATLHFKKDMMQLFWIMKEFNQSTKKIFITFPKKIYYPND